MPLTLRRGVVTAVGERLEELARIEVDGVPCVAYLRLTGPVEEGDEVVVNVQARELGLGSGGFDVLHANLTRGLDLPPEPGAHVMKLPYTPVQFARVHGEEETEPAALLEGTPVVACSLHSQLAPVCAALRGLRVAYVQLPGGALPVALSDTVRTLRREGLIELAIGAGACFGGDVGRRQHLLGARPGAGPRSPGGRRGDRPGNRRDRDAPRPRRHGRGRRDQRLPRARRPRGPGAADLPARSLGSAIAASRTTPTPCCRCGAARTTSRGLPAAPSSTRSRKERPWWTSRTGVGSAGTCRCRTWVADQTRTRGSSRPRSQPGALHAGCWTDGEAAPVADEPSARETPGHPVAAGSEPGPRRLIRAISLGPAADHPPVSDPSGEFRAHGSRIRAGFVTFAPHEADIVARLR